MLRGVARVLVGGLAVLVPLDVGGWAVGASLPERWRPVVHALHDAPRPALLAVPAAAALVSLALALGTVRRRRTQVPSQEAPLATPHHEPEHDITLGTGPAPDPGRDPLPRRPSRLGRPRGAWPTVHDPDRAVRGIVAEPDGRPLAHAVLTLVGAGGRQAGRTATRADGHYELPVDALGSYVLIASAPGHRPQALALTVGTASVELDVRLGGTVGLTGTVRRAGSAGTAVPNATALLTDARGEVVATATTDEDGVYRFGRLLPGAYTLAVSAEGMRPAALAVQLDGGAEPTELDVELPAGAVLRGIVRTRSGRPVEDARVTLMNAGGDVLASMITGADGLYRFEDLPPGDYTLVAAGYPPVATALDLAADELEHDLTLGHGAL
ncbi:hypothetical protein BIV57_22190 [Mangrovactinospora gilvigrisea]|uniref:Uncharacterized protein n=1 Tax=Mangrovactinospora gilvigrisea TaxID=1428644 RepID=A0A1J7B9S2_9ACTN|nr:hypothetical protein BIV57_22190 [Mangrovactinospora gilvigrisea]